MSLIKMARQFELMVKVAQQSIDVLMVQEALQNLVNPNIKIDGWLGPETQAAIDAFKRQRKIPLATPLAQVESMITKEFNSRTHTPQLAPPNGKSKSQLALKVSPQVETPKNDIKDTFQSAQFVNPDSKNFADR